MQFPDLLERFLSYVRIDTASSEESLSFPSTLKQLNLAQRLKQELQDLGLNDALINENGYVLATLKSNQEKIAPTIALIAHMDTSPDVTAEHVNPCIHRNHNGKDIILSNETGLLLKIKDNPELEEKVGQTIITTDGTSLLGADDKAGIAEIMSAIRYLIEHPDLPRPHIRIVFTPDEEVGRGTDKITVAEIAADAGYTVDGGPAGEIEDETFCADSMMIKISGVNVHPGTAKGKMINAVKIASEIVDRFPRESMSPETTEKREGYMHPHFISGTVEDATVKVLIRDFTEQGLYEKEDIINSIVQEAKTGHPGVIIKVNVEKSYRNMKAVLDRHPDIVEKAEKAIRLSGLTAIRTSIRGGTDGARLCFMGLPTPNLFTGGHNFHSRYEWISLEDMEKATEVIVRLMGLWTEKI
jgi:tripeptide aminopeptidase